MAIAKVSLENFRGISKRIDIPLASMNVLVGRNGVGKSTIIDAILVGAAQNPADALGRAIKRRYGVQHGGRWLIARTSGAENNQRIKASVRIESDSGLVRETRVSKHSAPAGSLVEDLMRGQRDLNPEDVESLKIQLDDGQEDAETRVTFEIALDPRNNYAWKGADVPEPLKVGAYVRLVDAKLIGEPLTDAFSRAVTSGNIDSVIQMLQQSDSSISALQILTDQDQPYLAATVRGFSMPLSLVGDGIRLLARLAFEMQSMREGGVLLIEEPEIHQHPRAVRAMAKTMVSASRRGVQVVVTTHSLDLVRAIRHQYSVESDISPNVAIFMLERVQDVIAITKSEGREIFSDPNWGAFSDRFTE